MLNYNIKGTGIEVTDELRSYVERRFAQVEKFLRGGPVQISVELEHQALRDGDRNRAEFTIGVHGAVYRAERWGETMHSAIDIAVGELVLELGRNKKKRIHVLRRSAHKVKEYLRGWRTKV